MCLNLHNQLDLLGISTSTLWLSVSLQAVTLPCSHSHSATVFSSLVLFCSQSHSSTAKSVFAMLATSHKEAFVRRIHHEIIQISCPPLGLYVLAVYVWKMERDLHILLCSVSWSLWKGVLCLLSSGRCVQQMECKWLPLHDASIMCEFVLSQTFTEKGTVSYFSCKYIYLKMQQKLNNDIW